MTSAVQSFLRRRMSAAEAGFSLPELLVSMVIFAVLLALMGTTIIEMNRDLRKTQGVSDASAQAQRAFDDLDRELREASSIDSATTQGGYPYLVFQSTSVTGSSTCYQWRVASGSLQQRSFSPSATTAPAWQTVATGLVNPPSKPPFTMIFANASTNLKQMVVIDLVVRRSANPPGTAETTTVLVGRNSSVSSQSNTDANNDGNSDNPVCT